MLKKILIILFVVSVIIFAIYFFNYNQLQSKMNYVVNNDSRNDGIVVNVHFGGYLQKSILEYNLKSISSNKSKADVFRVFLQFSEEMKENSFKQIYLSFRGNKKFIINGDYFNTLGKEYSFQNPIYIMRTFPENLKKLDGQNAYPEWTGGLLGVSNKQLEDFDDFHNNWYFNDLIK